DSSGRTCRNGDRRGRELLADASRDRRGAAVLCDHATVTTNGGNEWVARLPAGRAIHALASRVACDDAQGARLATASHEQGWFDYHRLHLPGDDLDFRRLRHVAV